MIDLSSLSDSWIYAKVNEALEDLFELLSYIQDRFYGRGAELE